MIRWLKERLAAAKAAEKQERIDAGFSWAAGELLMGRDKAAAYIEGLCFKEEADPFYRGALSALRRAREIGVVKSLRSVSNEIH